MAPDLPARLFDPDARARLQAVFEVDFDRPAVADLHQEDPQVLAGVDVLITGWGAGTIDDALLAAMPRLHAVHHAGGSVRDLVGEGCWRRAVRVTSSSDANAVPVAEYAVAMVLLSAKQAFRSQVVYRRVRAFVDREREFPSAGNHGAVVGLVGASRIGRNVIRLLRPYDLKVLVFDPFLSAAEAERLGVRSVGLDELLSRSSVVSLHAPLLESTRGMLGRRELALMQAGATLVNTARGALVDHDALVDELVSGRLWAVLDTTDPFEPLPASSPLYDLTNVVLTPHMAGAVGNELTRLGDHAVDSAISMFRGDSPVAGEVSEESAATMA
ncbi:hydroxyacid dehydrogenase [Phycicoccus sp. Soil803]|uniref:hydroxyacid dehydrogenase n=1 Tax=Phycicoccus sp. Soil803 TaxID=1736415 RepID=UPI0007101216|nr:hydroxyacid dehydrogenase [Phycicoccus sp. Soil803]KRF27075.1 hypothetical protein ASG95_20325 [Phycicoccus sp. Soil803]